MLAVEDQPLRGFETVGTVDATDQPGGELHVVPAGLEEHHDRNRSTAADGDLKQGVIGVVTYFGASFEVEIVCDVLPPR